MIKFFKNQWMNYNLTNQEINLPIINHSKFANESCALLIRSFNERNASNDIQEKINNGKIKAIISTQEILDKFENVEKYCTDFPDKCWAELCALNFPKQSLHIIAVTGTCGKTSTCFFTYQILRKMKKNVLLISTVGIYENDEFKAESINTTPDALTIRKNMHEFVEKYGEESFCIIETSSIGLEQNRIYSIHPEIGLFTNFSQEHMEYHKNMQDYFDQKIKLMPLCQKFYINKAVEIEQYAKNLQGFFQYGSELIETKYENNEFQIIFKFNEILHAITSNLKSDFQAKNILSSIIILQNYFQLDQIISLYQNLEPPTGRMIIYENVIIDHAHKPDAVFNIINSAKKLNPDKIIAVMGCGGDKDKIKRPIIGKILQDHCAEIILTTDNPRSEDPMEICKEMACSKAKIILDRELAIKEAMKILTNKDVLIICGKANDYFQEIKNEKINYAGDEKIVKNFLELKKST